MFVLFGRPGAGKSSVAKAVTRQFEQDNRRTMIGIDMEESSAIVSNCTKNPPKIQQNGMGVHDSVLCPTIFQLVPIDLDVCVPQWMRDNFAKGIYPTWQQRQEFAKDCCNHVHHVLRSELQEKAKQQLQQKTIIIMVSFSFVNADLRQRFRECFPDAHWILIDTSPHEAQRRIEQRRGHFYKGGGDPPARIDNNHATTEQKSTSHPLDNSEWEFAPVTFPHTILDGKNSIQNNATIILDWLKLKIH
jgi:thymidylate kinase